MWSYKRIYKPEHPYAMATGMILEHRHIAELKIGRYLNPEEDVHHIDENKTNNNPGNLVVFATRADHIRYHKTGVKEEISFGVYKAPETPSLKICTVCGNEFVVKSSSHMYCSHECHHLTLRVAERPKKSELINLLNHHSILSISKIFNVSDTTIRKWCKSYDIPTKKKDIKQFLENLR